MKYVVICLTPSWIRKVRHKGVIWLTLDQVARKEQSQDLYFINLYIDNMYNMFVIVEPRGGGKGKENDSQQYQNILHYACRGYNEMY
jgi:hypothetical protein